MAEAVSRRAMAREARLRSQVSPIMRIVVARVALGQVLVLRFSPVSIIPPIRLSGTDAI